MPVPEIGLRASRSIGDVPLIGREAELEEITSAFRSSETAAVVIAGRAGVGKSRLAAEVAGAMAAGGRPTEM